MKITVDLDLQEIVDDSVYGENTFKEEFSSVLKSAIVAELKAQCADAVMKHIAEPIGEQMKDVSDAIAKEILASDFKTRKFNFKIGYSSKEATIEELITDVMNDSMRDRILKTLESRSKEIVEDMKKRYDMAFASLIVDNMRKQHLLADDRLAELLMPSK